MSLTIRELENIKANILTAKIYQEFSDGYKVDVTELNLKIANAFDELIELKRIYISKQDNINLTSSWTN